MSKLIQMIRVFLWLFAIQSLQAQTVELTPLYHTIGVKVTNISTSDSCQIEYKKTQSTNWLLGYPPDKISINTEELFRGSLFGLEENETYEVKITLFVGANSTTLAPLQGTTLASPNFNSTGNIKWVSPNGTGDYSQNNPGNLSSLFSSGQVSCGTTIVLKDGIYSTNNLQLTFNNSCTSGTPIILMAEAGATPVFDASTTITTSWTPHATIPNLYSTPTPPGTSHSNICILGNKALYPYPSVSANALLGNYNLSALNFGYDGFVRDENSVWINTNTGIDPNDSVVKVSNSFRFLTIYGNNNNAFLKVKGIEFRYYGKPVLNSLGSSSDSYSATVFDFRNVHNVYFDSCRFVFNTSDLSFSNSCNHITVQNCSFKNDAGKWTHAMIKKSHDFVHLIVGTISSSRARNVETAAIFLHESKSVVIRNNLFDGLNSGVESYFDIGLKEDVDVYNNLFVDNFDAVECDGLWTNLRVWENEILRPMSGISAAPPLIGPRYFYRNVIHGMQGRRNESDDPYFIACSPVSSNYMGQGIGIKTNSAYSGIIPPGNLYFFNNTFHASDTLGFVFTSWQAEWRKAVFRNNTYSHTVSHPFFYFDLANSPTNGDFQIASDHDNYISLNSNSAIVTVKHIHGQYQCTDIAAANDLQNTLSSISGSSFISIQNPLQQNPLFVSTSPGGFELASTSPLIDAGSQIPGFYDFNGNFPDMGAKEYGSTNQILELDPFGQAISVFPNPSNAIFTLQLPHKSDLVTIRVFNYLGQEVLTVVNGTGQEYYLDLKNQKDGIYFIEIDWDRVKSVKKIIKISN